VDTVDRGLKQLQESAYVRVVRQQGGENEYLKLPKLVELGQPWDDVRRMGQSLVLADAEKLAQAAEQGPHQRRAAQRLAGLHQPTLIDRLQSPRGTAGPRHVWVPIMVLNKPSTMTTNAWRVLLGLYAYWQRHDWCTPSQGTLAWFLRINVASVVRGLAHLRRAGYVEVNQRWNSSNVYRKTEALLELEGLMTERLRAEQQRMWDRVDDTLRAALSSSRRPAPALDEARVAQGLAELQRALHDPAYEQQVFRRMKSRVQASSGRRRSRRSDIW
jgi:DNA-binding transcriptional regulator YhcF (GntR family)